MVDENFALGFNPSGLEADQGPTANSPMEKKLLQLSSVKLKYLQQLIQNNPATDIGDVINLNKKTLVPVQNTASAKVIEVKEKKKRHLKFALQDLSAKLVLEVLQQEPTDVQVLSKIFHSAISLFMPSAVLQFLSTELTKIQTIQGCIQNGALTVL